MSEGVGAKKRPPSRSQRWQDAAAEARAAFDRLSEDAESLNSALQELGSIKDEYQDWLDNLPDSLRDSPVGTKLQAVTDLDFDQEVDLSAVESVIDEAESADLPLGWGKD
jgi:hypothetical protein